MEFKAKRGDLLATLYWTQSIVERRNTMPILANVLLEAQKGSIRITATDLEVGVRGEVDGAVAKEGTVTDGHRLAFEEKAVGSLGLTKGVILPRKGLSELKKLLESGDEGVVSLGFKDNMGLVTKDKIELFMRLIGVVHGCAYSRLLDRMLC